MLEEKLQVLKSDLVNYATLVEKMIEKSIQGLLIKDRALLEEVISKDETAVNDLEITMDEHCTNLIAQYEPKAKELRSILMILKMSNDLERMGDHAVNISLSSQYLIELPAVKPLIDLPKMAEETIAMLKDSIQSFVSEDSSLAKKVCERDSVVDGFRNQILRELIAFMGADPSVIERSLHLIRISHNLERIADLSTNIGEDVIFMVAGKVIKHHKEEL
ncbi:MAG: phosphate signaling complex protein PhoU [Candidatus Eremiobacteraeota bacterium]|nr:phosphate signaling complex protein PhoU [Candidatus Eremiobacteraeota bacterium]MCL5056184.1 phosphate signaling complex protein PhoU [Bacillota bacterium]